MHMNSVPVFPLPLGAEAFDDAGHCEGVWDVVQLWSGVVAVEAGCAN
jgi:hypothetical protein